MRVVLNTLPLLSPLTGVGNYILQLARRLPLLAPTNEYTYFYGYFSRRLPSGNNSIYGATNSLKKQLPLVTSTLRQLVDLGSRFHLQKFHLYFEPNFIPLSIRAQKVVTTVHDFTFLSQPESQPKERMDYFRRHFHRRIGYSDRIITPSVYVKNEAQSFLNLPGINISPIHLGVEREIFKLRNPEKMNSYRNKIGVVGPFILYVGTLEPRKNLRRLIQSYLDLPGYLKKEFRLVLVGVEGWGYQEIGEILRKCGDRVIYLGYKDTEELSCLYNIASLFVFPSLYEGFGLPPLEAMACGCPVVVSNAAALPEICGDAAHYVDPKSVDSISEGISRVLSDEALRRALTVRGRARAELFSWDDTARRTLEVFDESCR